MNKLLAYSRDGLGAYVMFEDGRPTWIAVYGHGLDGNDLVMSGAVTIAGTATLFRRRAASTSRNSWPSQYLIDTVVGTVALHMPIAEQELELTFSLNRHAIGAPAIVDFSPMPEERIVTTLSLARLI